MFYRLFAHAGPHSAEGVTQTPAASPTPVETHTDAAAPAANSLADTLAHLPVWQAMLLAVAVLVAGYAVLSLLKLKPISRVFGLLPLVIALTIFYMQHQPQVSGLLLSGGFIVVFVLAFAMLKAPNS